MNIYAKENIAKYNWNIYSHITVYVAYYRPFFLIPLTLHRTLHLTQWLRSHQQEHLQGSHDLPTALALGSAGHAPEPSGCCEHTQCAVECSHHSPFRNADNSPAVEAEAKGGSI